MRRQQKNNKLSPFFFLFFERSLNLLSDSELRSFYSLCDSHTDRGLTGFSGSSGFNGSNGLTNLSGSDRKSNYGIIKTNSFCIKWPQKESDFRLAIFPQIARINHACVPNCHHYWNVNRRKFTVRAVKKIK
jgi:hypothetical protein